MNQQQLGTFAFERLPTYLSNRFVLGKSIRRNNLRQGQKLIAISKNTADPFYFVAEILGFGSRYDLDDTHCIIPTTPPNIDDDPLVKGNIERHLEDFDPEYDEVPDPVLFTRSAQELADTECLEESVRIYDAEMSPIGLSDEGFDAFESSQPILIAKSLRRVQKAHIALQRHGEFQNWVSPRFSPLSFFELLPKSNHNAKEA